jgi:hypothetical protein
MIGAYFRTLIQRSIKDEVLKSIMSLINPTAGMHRSKAQTALLAAGFGGVLFALTFLVLGAIAPGYDALRETISALEFTPLGFAQRISFFVFGLMLMAFALALHRELVAGRGAVLIPTFQFLSGVGVAGDAIFIHEPLHLVCDLIAFNSSLLVLFLFAWRFSGDSHWKGWTDYSILTALLMMAFLTAFGVANHLGGPAGAFEKLASMTRTFWSALLVGKLYSGRRLIPTRT